MVLTYKKTIDVKQPATVNTITTVPVGVTDTVTAYVPLDGNITYKWVARDVCTAIAEERDYWKQRASLAETYARKDCWFWMNDGLDHPESMVDSLTVVIKASDLKRLIKNAQK